MLKICAFLIFTCLIALYQPMIVGSQEAVENSAIIALENHLTESLKNGLIRKSTQEDYLDWLAKAVRRYNVPDHKVEQEIEPGRLNCGSKPDEAFVVLSHIFYIPDPSGSLSFFVPDGLDCPQPAVNPHSTYSIYYYMLKDGTCFSFHCNSGICR